MVADRPSAVTGDSATSDCSATYSGHRETEVPSPSGRVSHTKGCVGIRRGNAVQYPTIQTRPAIAPSQHLFAVLRDSWSLCTAGRAGSPRGTPYQCVTPQSGVTRTPKPLSVPDSPGPRFPRGGERAAPTCADAGLPLISVTGLRGCQRVAAPGARTPVLAPVRLRQAAYLWRDDVEPKRPIPDALRWLYTGPIFALPAVRIFRSR